MSDDEYDDDVDLVAFSDAVDEDVDEDSPCGGPRLPNGHAEDCWVNFNEDDRCICGKDTPEEAQVREVRRRLQRANWPDPTDFAGTGATGAFSLASGCPNGPTGATGPTGYKISGAYMSASGTGAALTPSQIRGRWAMPPAGYSLGPTEDAIIESTTVTVARGLARSMVWSIIATFAPRYAARRISAIARTIAERLVAKRARS